VLAKEKIPQEREKERKDLTFTWTKMDSREGALWKEGWGGVRKEHSLHKERGSQEKRPLFSEKGKKRSSKKTRGGGGEG